MVGAGPTGLMLASELALGGANVRLLEERTDMPNITRAFAVHARTLELLDARGMADELLTRGVPVYEIAPPGGATLNLRELPSRFAMVFIAPQSGTEHVLQTRVDELGVPIVRGAQVVGLTQDDDGVTVECADGNGVRAKYVVGCDGAHSTVRRLVGIEWVGKQYETHILLADVRLTRAPEDTLTGVTNERGVVLMIPFGDGWFRAIGWDRLREQAPLKEPVTLEEIRDAFHRIAGEDFGMTEMRWSSRFLSERKQAEHYRADRVFIAGDAAHVHSPLGGQGMNTGIGDAMNLGWKLCAALRGTAPGWLLDSYEGERHPVGAAVLRLTDAFNQLVLGPVQGTAPGSEARRRRVDPGAARSSVHGRTSQPDRHRLSARLPRRSPHGRAAHARRRLRRHQAVRTAAQGSVRDGDGRGCRRRRRRRRRRACRAPRRQAARRGIGAPGRLCRVGR